MPEVFIAKAAKFPDGERRIVAHDGREIGVFHWQGKFYAYKNLCVHQGGPACEGIMMHKVDDVIGPDRSWAETQLLYSSDYPHWDFDLPSTIYDLPFLSEQAKRNILGGNAIRLFNLRLPAQKLARAT